MTLETKEFVIFLNLNLFKFKWPHVTGGYHDEWHSASLNSSRIFSCCSNFNVSIKK